MTSRYTYAILITLVVASVFYISCCNRTVPTETVTRTDTLWVEVQLPPIEVEGKAKTKVVRRTDTVIDEQYLDYVYELLNERDSLHRELSKYATETITIDTIVGLDTIRLDMDYYTLLWKLDIRRGHIDVPTIIKTVEKYYDNRNDKWYAGVIGYVLGVLTVIAILLGG